MCSTQSQSESETKVKPCDLCGGGTDGSNRSTLRGLTLCYDCDRGLAGGTFSCPGLQSERRSMNQGHQFVAGKPWPAKMLETVWGSKADQAAAIMAKQQAEHAAAVARHASRVAPHLAVAASADPFTPFRGSMDRQADKPAPQPAPVRLPYWQSVVAASAAMESARSKPAKQSQPVSDPINHQPRKRTRRISRSTRNDWRTNAAAVVAAVHVA